MPGGERWRRAESVALVGPGAGRCLSLANYCATSRRRSAAVYTSGFQNVLRLRRLFMEPSTPQPAAAPQPAEQAKAVQNPLTLVMTIKSPADYMQLAGLLQKIQSAPP